MEDEIENAYRKKTTKYHPDVFDEDGAEEKFKKVQRTKEVFTNDEERQMHDQAGHECFQQSQKRNGGGGDRGQGNPFDGGDNPFGGMDDGGDGFRDTFNNLFNGDAGGQQRNRPQQGCDVAQRISIDFEDAYHDVEYDVTIRHREVCSKYDGEGHPEDANVNICSEYNSSGQQTTVQQTFFGRVQQATTCRACGGKGETCSEDCSECHGGGRVCRARDAIITVPTGFRDDQRLCCRGEDRPGENDGPSGDLFVEVNIHDHDEFDHDGDNFRYTYPISSPQAVSGATVEMPTLGGEEELRVSAGTQSGSIFTVSNAGMPYLDDRGNGDLHVEIHVVTLEDLSSEQREVLKGFAEAGGEEVKEGLFQKLKDSL